MDASLEFEKRRNEPVKYNKELWQNTGDLVLFSRFLHCHQISVFIDCMP